MQSDTGQPQTASSAPALLETSDKAGGSPPAPLPPWFPGWARDLADLYFSGTTCLFILHGNVHDLLRVGGPGLVALSFLLAVTQWASIALTYWIGFAAFHLPVGYAGAVFTTCVTALGVSIPSSPGFVGTFQAFAVEALAVFGVDRLYPQLRGVLVKGIRQNMVVMAIDFTHDLIEFGIVSLEVL